jgi:hypothetical protein
LGLRIPRSPGSPGVPDRPESRIARSPGSPGVPDRPEPRRRESRPGLWIGSGLRLGLTGRWEPRTLWRLPPLPPNDTEHGSIGGDVGQIGDVRGGDPGLGRRLEEEEPPVQALHIASPPTDQPSAEVHQLFGHVVGQLGEIYGHRNACTEVMPDVEHLVVVLRA